jgi:quinoprotein glucose dehydrogenase
VADPSRRGNELAARGIHNTGSFWPRGGAVITAGGLIIVGTKSDAKLHIYDKDTGKQISEVQMPAGPEGIPSIYEVAGREYIVISARPNPEKPHIGDQPPSGSDPTVAAGSRTLSTQEQAKQGYYAYALPLASSKNR